MQAFEKQVGCAIVPEIRKDIGFQHFEMLLLNFASMKSLNGSSILDYKSQSKAQQTAFSSH